MGKRQTVLYKLLYFLVNFFVQVGEFTKYIFLLPIRLVALINKYIIGYLRFLVNVRPKLPRLKIKPRLSSIRFFAFKLRKKFKKIYFYAVKKPKKEISRFFFFVWSFVPRRRIKRSPFVFKLRYFLLGFSVALIIVFVQNSYNFVKSLPSPRNIGKMNYSLSTHIYDRDGRLLYEFYREQNRTPVRLSNLPPYVWQASVAIEDKDFFKHNGVSPLGGIARALKENILNKQFQGGSTITQQLVKSALLTPERTIQRKVKEIILALWTERIFSKEQILEMYLNQVPYGGSSYGIEEASKTYFGKSAKDLNIQEAALLAGLPAAPSLYSPQVNPALARQRRNEVLKRMLDQHYLSQDKYERFTQSSIEVLPPRTTIKAPHFVFYVKDNLTNTYGIRNVEEGGMNVTTSLDLEIQKQVDSILKEELNKIKGLNVSNGAILVTRPQTGEILAMAGSYDYFDSPSGAFNVTTALRQPGSSIKPIMYSLALQRGYTAATVIDDSPITFSNPWGAAYRPVNYDGKYHGRVPLRYALANSYNVPAVKVLNTIGVQDFVDHAKEMGISTWTDPSRFGLSLTLGGGEVTMIDMAKAFGVFANMGEKKDITPIEKITNQAGQTMFENRARGRRVLSSGVSYIISDILSDNTARVPAFGPHSALEIPGYKVSVKTGTTNDKRDNWTIGYTPEFMVVVWVGNNDNSPMNPALTSGITGAAPIWNKVMSYLLTNYGHKDSWFAQPEDIVAKNCYGSKVEYFLKGTENSVSCVKYSLTPSVSPSPRPQ